MLIATAPFVAGPVSIPQGTGPIARAKRPFTPEYLAALIRYDGRDFYWLPRDPVDDQTTKFNERFANQPVRMVPHHKGYYYIHHGGKRMFAHRVAWVLYHGKWPDGVIDHINGDGRDNRIENLRDATCAENARNRRLKPRLRDEANLLGSTHQNRTKWRSQVFIGGDKVAVGTFDTREEAIAARVGASKALSFLDGS